MSNIRAKRVMLAAMRSGSGKTTITCALLEALKKRDLEPVSFKCGPDYIDPMFHKKVLGIEGRNLDTFFAGQEGVRKILSRAEDKYCVIEGVMGLYDGAKVESLEGSSYEVAEATGTPIILIADAGSCGRTIISQIKGILFDDKAQLIKGIILNKISESFYNSLLSTMEEEIGVFRSDVKILGFFPKSKDISIESRHLGLKLPGEIQNIKNQIEKAGELLEKTVDVHGIFELMDQAESMEIGDNADIMSVCKTEDSCSDTDSEKDLTLAVAYDEAFCFYYADNLDMFRENGVKIKFFSPLRDRKLPEDVDGILLGGGYPELYLKELSDNKSMLVSIREAIEKGIPSLAECGGFMYLHKTITDPDGTAIEMVGAIDADCSYSGHLVRFGYMQIAGANDTALLQDDLSSRLIGMKGHEFHYYDSSFNGDSFIARKPYRDQRWNCIITSGNGIWGFPHFYYPSKPDFITGFIDKMKGYAYLDD